MQLTQRLISANSDHGEFQSATANNKVLMSTSFTTDYTLTVPSAQCTANYVLTNYWGSVLIFGTALLVLPSYISTLMCFMSKNTLGFSILVCFLVFYLVMVIWSFALTHSTAPPSIPERYYFTKEENAFVQDYEKTTEVETRQSMHERLSDMARRRGIRTCARDGSVNYCITCKIIKPERTHHCSICQQCVLRMDHHCPFFGNCIHFENAKFFLLTLFYGCLGAIYVLVTGVACLSMRSSMPECSNRSFFWFGAMTLYCGLLAILVSLFFAFSMKNAMHNQTTLESMSDIVFIDGKPHSYDLGSVRSNLKQIFGPISVLWLVPVHTTPGDGTDFPLRDDLTSIEFT
ncbi:palmitoyltransferase ZDHHC15B-like [Galendromus occidentalis]|uniref:Palmitoyltransferase n=1 Tax=Galendromus occidentalis TaxID=34638 RepID=A0AAJ6QX87_9ACAR|nr:palmitoyltransferase ZDHHC15B-like [Galendromus occidentalis]